MKYDNLARSLAMMEAELERAGERVKNAESKVVVIEDELGSIGENQKQLEISEEKARKREEKYQVSCDWTIAILLDSDWSTIPRSKSSRSTCG